jgi:hypothetical protein
MEPHEIGKLLSAPFPADILGWKPQVVSQAGDRALVVAYLDARDVQDRLDEVVGCENWQDDYEVLSNGSVVCRLSVYFPIDTPSDQPDVHDKMKAAFSDALKRAGIKFGIGRYLYRLPLQWVDYDGKKKQLVGTPKLPDWARPKPKPSANGGATAAAPPTAPASAAPPTQPADDDPSQIYPDDPDRPAQTLAGGPSQQELREQALAILRPATLHGERALEEAWYEQLTKEQRQAAKNDLPHLKEEARYAESSQYG